MEEITPEGGKLIQFHIPDITNKEINKVKEVMKSGWLGKGTKVDIFEDMVKEYTEAKYAVALNSCTAALYWAIITLTEPDSEIIVPALTFTATANAVECAGRKVVFADIDIDTLNMDNATLIEKVRTNKARAIIPVHFGGIPCNMDKLKTYATVTDLHIIEDCAQAFGAKWNNKSVGTFGTTGCFSFHATKNITTGVGGILTTEFEPIASTIRKRIEHGKKSWNKSYDIVIPGLEDYMSDVNAAIGIIQMERFDKIQTKRRKIWERYCGTYWGKVEPYNIIWNRDKDFEQEMSEAKFSYHKYSIILKIDKLPFTRDEFIDIMWKKGIECKAHYRPLPFEPYYQRKYGYKEGDFPNAEYIGDRIVALPLHTKMTDEDVNKVIYTIKEIIGG